ncbi:MAG: hypothetical protein KF856_14130 [Cyclobacteriaceae bacterium]|nr:hypothetical protein [Cyclobacteriaceae bacterium]
MKLVELLEQPQTKAQRDRIISQITSQQKFDELMLVFAAGPYRVTQRAAWPLSYCVQRQPAFLNKHFATIAKMLEATVLADAIKRNLLRALQFVQIPIRYQGRIANCCFAFLTSNEPTAIKVFAMTVLANLANTNRELKNEIVLILESQLPFGSPGFVSRARKVLKQLR